MTDEEADAKYKEFHERLAETEARAEGYEKAAAAARDQLSAIYRERDAWEATIPDGEANDDWKKWHGGP